MKSATHRHLLYALKILAGGRQIYSIGLFGLAAREAYLAAFHAAQALIYEATDKAPKSHKGVHVEFSRLALQFPELGTAAARHLSAAYDAKTIHDYEGTREVPAREAETMLQASDAVIRAVCIAIGGDYESLLVLSRQESSTS